MRLWAALIFCILTGNSTGWAVDCQKYYVALNESAHHRTGTREYVREEPDGRTTKVLVVYDDSGLAKDSGFDPHEVKPSLLARITGVGTRSPRYAKTVVNTLLAAAQQKLQTSDGDDETATVVLPISRRSPQELLAKLQEAGFREVVTPLTPTRPRERSEVTRGLIGIIGPPFRVPQPSPESGNGGIASPSARNDRSTRSQ